MSPESQLVDTTQDPQVLEATHLDDVGPVVTAEPETKTSFLPSSAIRDAEMVEAEGSVTIPTPASMSTTAEGMDTDTEAGLETLMSPKAFLKPSSGAPVQSTETSLTNSAIDLQEPAWVAAEEDVPRLPTPELATVSNCLGPDSVTGTENLPSNGSLSFGNGHFFQTLQSSVNHSNKSQLVNTFQRDAPSTASSALPQNSELASTSASSTFPDSSVGGTFSETIASNPIRKENGYTE
ncbi:hypothetical protein CF319_g9406 [Tilletia indica]|nr:hypothetical protein CF319_g9406 [Tilletia indica]